MTSRFITELHIDWDKIPKRSYIRGIKALNTVDSIRFESNVTFLVGENGSGKSTLLEAMAVAYGFNPEGGTFNYNFSTYDDYSELCDAISLYKGIKRRKSGYFFRAESFFNVATAAQTEYNYDGGMPDYHSRSHGESFLEFLQNDQREGLYLMDEPEAALSPQRQLSLIIHIARMAKEGSQFIIATHSPVLLGVPNAVILNFDDSGINPIEYEETESYQITKLFLDNREEMLRRLLSE